MLGHLWRQHRSTFPITISYALWPLLSAHYRQIHRQLTSATITIARLLRLSYFTLLLAMTFSNGQYDGLYDDVTVSPASDLRYDSAYYSLRHIMLPQSFLAASPTFRTYIDAIS